MKKNPGGLSEQSPNSPTQALLEIARQRGEPDPLQGTGCSADGLIETGPLEETEGSR